MLAAFISMRGKYADLFFQERCGQADAQEQGDQDHRPVEPQQAPVIELERPQEIYFELFI
jgi:hypothetical protein